MERKKFELAQEVRDEADVLVLQGFRQMKAVAFVRDFLKNQGKGYNEVQMETWSLVFCRVFLCSACLPLRDRAQTR